MNKKKEEYYVKNLLKQFFPPFPTFLLSLGIVTGLVLGEEIYTKNLAILKEEFAKAKGGM